MTLKWLISSHLRQLSKYCLEGLGCQDMLYKNGGAVCKGATPFGRATGRSWVQAPAAILARLGNKYLLKSLMISNLHSASLLYKLP